ncbi:MAG: DoxX family protein [Candidatus Paceibacteria bacterium]
MKRILKTDTALLLLRFTFGWLFFYAGITKVINPQWSAKGFLENAQTFSGFYSWLASPNILPTVDFLNEWGLTLIGIALILGVLVRLSAYLGALLMVLYYFPGLSFPYIGEHSLLVDDHIIYALGLLLLASLSTKHHWGIFASRLKR